MCGLAGIYHFKNQSKVSKTLLVEMLEQISHRGPDEAGIFLSNQVGLGNTRLSIVDLDGGSQPIHNGSKTNWIVFTGEIYNFQELRQDLLRQGRHFYTKSDTEVILHLYEEEGISFLQKLQGQFAIAIWDQKQKKLILARDRVGIRPLFYTIQDGRLLFASEIKAIFADPKISRQLNLHGLHQIVTFWTTVGSTTIFDKIEELPPAHYLEIRGEEVRIERYWTVPFIQSPRDGVQLTKDESIETLRSVLSQSVKTRIPNEVPLGAYVSGGVDSSVIATLLHRLSDSPENIKTFSIQFEDQDHDESSYQNTVLKKLGMKNFAIRCSSKDIGDVFPKVVWHAESPLFRTAAAPLYLLSERVRQEGIKVVLSGEGADEVLWGYDTYREHKIRLFWSRNPNSTIRPLLLKKIFPYLSHFGPQFFMIIKKFYEKNLMDKENPFYSHLPRWSNHDALRSFYSRDMQDVVQKVNPVDTLSKTLPKGYEQWHPLEQNQYLEMSTLLKGYLLSSQGDRMLMANSVEGRYPFLDTDLIQAAARFGPQLKVRGLRDKFILREAFKNELPVEIYKRSKFAYTAPDAKSFFGEAAPSYVKELVSDINLKNTGYFDTESVRRLTNKLRLGQAQKISYRDNMASVIIVSTLLLHELFIKQFARSQKKLVLTVCEEGMHDRRSY